MIEKKEWKELTAGEKASVIYFIIVVYVGLYYTFKWSLEAVTYLILKLMPEKKPEKKEETQKNP